jgi:hypothetical protein
MIIYNVFIPFYPKKSINTPFGALIFQKFGQWFPTPANWLFWECKPTYIDFAIVNISIRLMPSDQPG